MRRMTKMIWVCLEQAIRGTESEKSKGDCGRRRETKHCGWKWYRMT
jgi:hypothetical protein